MKIFFIILISIVLSKSFQEPDFIQKKNKNISIVFTEDAPLIDGVVDKDIWDKMHPISDFLQEDPIPMSNPSKLTMVKILYDQHNLYVLAQMFVDDPKNIESRLVNRDNWEDGFDGASDYFSIDIDSRHDHQTGFIFSVNAAGVQADAVVFDDSGYDPEWNSVWESEVTISNNSWIVEMKIPFSCLRFTYDENMKWGLNMYRYIHYTNEYIAWVAYPVGIPGISSKYGHLIDINGIIPNKRLEILPHLITGRSVFYDVNLKYPTFDPLQHEEFIYFDSNNNYGVDIKYGLGSNSTLDITLNPDFGQIEADPSEINLTYYQTRFTEKRPFFIENNTIFDTPIEIFYSRRVGENDAVIKNAQKITGKTSSGITYGLINANSNFFTTKINYGVARLAKDLLIGNSYIGLMSSHYKNNKNINNDIISFDGVFSLLDNKINTDGQFVISKNDTISGVGYFGEFKYIHPEIFSFWIETDYYDKNLFINDIGYLRRNNFVNYSGGIGLSFEYPFFNVKRFSVESIYRYNSTIDELVLFNQFEGSLSLLFKNYYEIGFGLSRNFQRFDDWATYDYELDKVGPILKLSQTDGFSFFFSTDNTKPINFTLLYGNGRNILNDFGMNYSASLEYKFLNNFRVSLDRYYAESSETFHWIEILEEENVGAPNTNHYIFANSRNHIFTTTFRFEGSISRNLGFQFYSEFFNNRNKFSNYSELLYDQSFPTDTTEYINTLPYVDLNPDESSGELLDPNLYVGLYSRFSELNTNFVLQWQYKPGSSIYLVYSLNKFVNGRIFSDYFDFLRYNQPSNWEEILFDQSIYFKIDYWFNI